MVIVDVNCLNCLKCQMEGGIKMKLGDSIVEMVCSRCLHKTNLAMLLLQICALGEAMEPLNRWIGALQTTVNPESNSKLEVTIDE